MTELQAAEDAKIILDVHQWDETYRMLAAQRLARLVLADQGARRKQEEEDSQPVTEKMLRKWGFSSTWIASAEWFRYRDLPLGVRFFNKKTMLLIIGETICENPTRGDVSTLAKLLGVELEGE